MDVNDAVVNSCRICGSPNQDGDFECLYEDHFPELSATGRLYEELLGIHIDRETAVIYPQYICNSCDLQIKLFKKLTTKAKKTIDVLRALYSRSDSDEEQSKFSKCFDFKTELERKQRILLQSGQEELGLEVKIEDLEQQAALHATESEIKFAGEQREELDYEQLQEDDKQVEDHEILDVIEGLEHEHIPERQLESALSAEYDSTNIESEEFVLREDDNLGEENDSDIRGYDYVEILKDNSKDTNSTTYFIDVHYLDDALDDPEFNELLKETSYKKANERDKGSYCRMCKKQLSSRAEFLKHKKENHSVKYPCVECGKVFQTSDAHNVHQKLHFGQPAYICEICSKTFNQKVHYNNHMAKHNNIRNFKCEICEKAFITKGDLSIHIRTHTGDRRYSCDICHKEFLLHVHMKNHRYSHFEKEFECKICQQKFVSPSTLRTHTQTIHESEPRFQCTYCVKKFRRKHHLIAHYKVHRKRSQQFEVYETLQDEVGNNEVTEECSVNN